MKRIIVSGAVMALAVAGVQAATSAPNPYKVTGGGQITELGEDGRPVAGPGNTIAFNAQGDGSTAKGQVQYIDRTAGTGQAQERFHGYVTCVTVIQPSEAGPGSARIQGQMRGDASDSPVDFTIDLVDNGQGSAADMDMITFRKGAPEDADDDENTTCDTDDDFQADGALGRGNVKIHKEKGASSGSEGSEQTAASSTAKGKKS